jgi:hypothetical protein
MDNSVETVATDKLGRRSGPRRKYAIAEKRAMVEETKRNRLGKSLWPADSRGITRRAEDRRSLGCDDNAKRRCSIHQAARGAGILRD